MPDSRFLSVHLTEKTDRHDSRRQQQRQERRANGKKQCSHPSERWTRLLHLPIPRSSTSSSAAQRSWAIQPHSGGQDLDGRGTTKIEMRMPLIRRRTSGAQSSVDQSELGQNLN